MRFALLIENKSLITILTQFDNILLRNLFIMDILEANDLNIHHLESDLLMLIKQSTTSDIYFDCIKDDLLYYRDIASLDISAKVIHNELVLIINDIQTAISKIKIKSKKLISIGIEFPNTISLEYI